MGKLGALGKAIWLIFVTHEDTKGFYDSFSHQYDVLVGAQLNGAEAARFLAEYFDGKKLARVLELGCDTGLFSQHITAVGDTLHGLDFFRRTTPPGPEQGFAYGPGAR